MISVEEKKCIGCGRCVAICPGNLLAIKDSVAAIRDVRDCWGCTACVKICPRNAIAYQLSAELGGAGAKLFAQDTPTKLTWRIIKSDGENIFFEVAKDEANKF